MSRVVITAQQVKAALDATSYSSIESNIQAVLQELGKRPALLTAYLSTVLTLPWLKPRDSCELGLLGFRRYV